MEQLPILRTCALTIALLTTILENDEPSGGAVADRDSA